VVAMISAPLLDNNTVIGTSSICIPGAEEA